MDLDKAIKRANAPKGKQDQDAVTALHHHLGRRAVLFIDSGKIDAAKTDKALTTAKASGRDAFVGGPFKAHRAGGPCMTVDEWLAAGEDRLEADPITGGLLTDGISADDDDGADWSDVPKGRRLLAAWAAQQSKVGRSARERHAVVAELAKDQPLTKMWQAIEQQVAGLSAVQKEALEERLYFTKEDGAPFVVAAEPAPQPVAAAPQVYVGGSAYGAQFVTGNGVNVELPPGQTIQVAGKCAADGAVYSCGKRHIGGQCMSDIGTCGRPPQRMGASPAQRSADERTRGQRCFIVVDDADKAAAAALRKAGWVTFGKSSDVPGTDTMPAGLTKAGYYARALAAADIVIPILSADLLANTDMMALCEEAILQRKRVIPVLWRPCMRSGWTANLSPLPAKPIAGSSNTDAAWCEVATGIDAVMKHLGF